jgi:hypothetical protein
MTAAETLLEVRDGGTRAHRGVGLSVEGGKMQRSAVEVCKVRVLIYCRRSL